jgi:hypothetical protein
MLVTLANTKTFLGISDNTKDAVLNILINAISDYIENYCGRTFASTVYTDEEYDGNAAYEMRLKNFPIIIPPDVIMHRNNSWDSSDDWETVDSDDYWVDEDTGIITKNTVFHKGKQNYRFTYTAGYATIPNDIQYACMVMVSEALSRKDNTGLKAESLGDHSVTYMDVIEQNQVVKDILNGYRDYAYL